MTCSGKKTRPGSLGKLACILLSGLLFLGGTCDHTRLTGEILVDQVRVGDKVPLMLIVPPELSGIHGVVWTVFPSDMAEVQPAAEPRAGERAPDTPAPGPVRRVWLKALKPGKCTISAQGFYRQTNLQPIAEKEIRMSE